MNILMMTNTYKPLLGGLERSIENFTIEYRKAGHRVIIVAPEYPNMQVEEDVIRIPAMQNFNGSDFSIQLPAPGALTEALGDLKPHLIHTHHPFLVGDTALRMATKYNVPLVFTHHTLYEENVHYVPGNDEALKRFVVELSTGYANLADQVFAPSESVMRLMKERGVTTPIEVVPTGIDIEKFRRGDAKSFRKKQNIPDHAFVVGHVGRLAPEKNLEFVTHAVAKFMKEERRAHYLIGGSGPSQEAIKDIMEKNGVADRLHLAGVVKGQDLIDTYHAMDVFVFASQSETQGLVVTEAMAAGIPVIAVDAPGVREVVEDGVNGRLLARESIEDLVVALQWLVAQSPAEITKMKKACLQTAHEFSLEKCAERALKIYVNLVVEGFFRKNVEDSAWTRTTRMIQTQWDLVKNLTIATGAMISPAMGTPASSDVNHPSSVQSPETTKNNDTESLFVNQP
jgi:1,2-diacylglycerol 3-alpha-glucosyltransferase